MESLALFAAIMLLGLVLSTLAALLFTWRARTNRGHVAAVVCALPGLALAVKLAVSVDSPGARLFGLIGMSGFAVAAYRGYRFISAQHRAE